MYIRFMQVSKTKGLEPAKMPYWHLSQKLSATLQTG